MRIKNQEPGIKTSQGASEKGFIAQMTVNGVFAGSHDEAICFNAGDFFAILARTCYLKQ